VNYKLRTYVRLKGITTTNSGVQMTNRTKLSPYRSQIAGVNWRWFWIRQRQFGTKTCNFLDHSLDLQEFKNIDQDVQTKFEVLTVVLIKISMQYNIPQCGLVYRVRCFKAISYLHLQGIPKINTNTSDHQHKVPWRCRKLVSPTCWQLYTNLHGSVF
jgi:hypothetical protein